MNDVGIGVIGMGWMGHAHSRSYRQIPWRFPHSELRPRLIVCSDTVEERARLGKDLLGFDEATTDWQQVIAHPDVQAVNITAPNSEHVEIGEAAAAAGKHIYCEKPVGRSPEETAAIERAARKAGVLSFVGYNYRWAPMVQHAKRLVAEGKLGTATHYRGRFFSMYGSDPLGLRTWRFDAEVSGLGVLGDLMSHAIDMAHHLNGPIARLAATHKTFITERPLPVPGKGTHYGVGDPDDPTGPVTNEDYAGAVVEFENGSVGTLEASRTALGPRSEMAFEFSGTTGALRWNLERMNELEVFSSGDPDHDGYTTLLGGPAYPHHGNFAPGDGLGLSYEDLKVIEAFEFLRTVASGTQGAPGLAEALAVADVQAAMMRSWESGAWEDVQTLRLD